jgi:hypothetical protein
VCGGHGLHILNDNRRDVMTELQENQVAESEHLDRNLDPITGATGSHPVGTGLGAVGGMTAGLVMGSVAGPIGTAVGGAVGTVVGGLAGKGLGEMVNPTAEEEVLFGELIDQQTPTPMSPTPTSLDTRADELYWQRAFITEPYYDSNLNYDDYAPAYRAGIVDRLNHTRSWDDAEVNLQALWNRYKGTSRLSWDEAKQAMRAAWYRTDKLMTEVNPYGMH